MEQALKKGIPFDRFASASGINRIKQTTFGRHPAKWLFRYSRSVRFENQISHRLKLLGLSCSDVKNQVRLRKLLELIFSEMGLTNEAYIDQTGNLKASYAILLINEVLGVSD